MPAGPAPMTAIRREWPAEAEDDAPLSDTWGILTRPGPPAPDQVQALFRSNPLTMYWVSVTRPPGVSAGSRQSPRASASELEPASQLGRLARLLLAGTLPTICVHCWWVEYRPIRPPRAMIDEATPSSVARLRARASVPPVCQVLVVSTSSHHT